MPATGVPGRARGPQQARFWLVGVGARFWLAGVATTYSPARHSHPGAAIFFPVRRKWLMADSQLCILPWNHFWS